MRVFFKIILTFNFSSYNIVITIFNPQKIVFANFTLPACRRGLRVEVGATSRVTCPPNPLLWSMVYGLPHSSAPLLAQSLTTTTTTTTTTDPQLNPDREAK